MIIGEIKSIESGKKELRKFGITLGVVSCIWISLLFWHKKIWHPYFFIISVSFVFLALICPIIFKPLHKILNTIFILINWIITRFALCAIFYFGFTLTRIVALLFGKRFLDLKIDKDTDSYWILKETEVMDKDRYQKQF